MSKWIISPITTVLWYLFFSNRTYFVVGLLNQLSILVLYVHLNKEQLRKVQQEWLKQLPILMICGYMMSFSISFLKATLHPFGFDVLVFIDFMVRNRPYILFLSVWQVVRTDLQELVNLDLEGAPYGYTPFCDDRKEMDGFRFWKTGYWQSHLQSRPYHISALYVVDLVKFRKMAAGDRLRGQYHALSRDPNSLSNLDQDLPNNMIHQVSCVSYPLFSMLSRCLMHQTFFDLRFLELNHIQSRLHWFSEDKIYVSTYLNDIL